MDIRLAVEFFLFFLLVFWHLSDKSRRAIFFKRTLDENVIDGISLFIQGIIIPVSSYFLIYRLYDGLFPALKGTLKISNELGFLLNFVLVDFVFYWIHRLFHSRRLWGFHLVHHSARAMDVIVSSRNTIWTSFFFPYLWLNSYFIFILENKTGFVLSISITTMLDLWRHSSLFINPQSQVAKAISWFFVTPVHHAWHHSRSHSRVNFGANLSIWDRVFGTYLYAAQYPDDLGFNLKSDLKTKLLLPFKVERENR